MIGIAEAQALYSGKDAAHNFDHVLRVLKLAERIGSIEGADMQVLRAAVLLHDIARADEDAGGACHAEVGAERARLILAGQPAEQVEAVAQAILAHRFRGAHRPRTVEAMVLHDADKLDAIGAIGVARAYAIAGRCAQRLWAKVPPGYHQRGLADARGDVASEDHTPVHEFRYKLSRLHAMMLTETARQMALSRHQFMVEFFERLQLEVEGEA
jgi:uncharacterized protein